MLRLRSAWYFCSAKVILKPYGFSDIIFAFELLTREAHITSEGHITHLCIELAAGEYNWKKHICLQMCFFLAAELGFEPRHTESESAVLPLHNSAMFLEQMIFYHKLGHLSRDFWKFIIFVFVSAFVCKKMKGTLCVLSLTKNTQWMQAALYELTLCVMHCGKPHELLCGRPIGRGLCGALFLFALFW